MKVAIIGTGYVGLPTGVGLAELGHTVICVDQVQGKIDALNRGEITLYEEGLEELFKKNTASGRLTFTTDMRSAVAEADIVLIAVGTPSDPVTHEADLQYVYAAVEELAEYLTDYTVIAMKSTVPVGTGDCIERIIRRKNQAAQFDVISLPEFLREGFAVHDFFHPDRIIVGSNSEKATGVIKELYRPFQDKTKMVFVSRRSSETIKYASNSFLAMKIHYINEMADFCEKAGADVSEVAKGMGLDSRIGPKFLNAGIGFGGSCFPKDTMALAYMGQKFGVPLDLVEATIKGNEQRKKVMADRILNAVKDIPNARIGVLGLAFKNGTDDCRQSPAMDIVTEILRINPKAHMTAFDPKAMDTARTILGDKITYAADMYAAADGADILVILTEWPEFSQLDFDRLSDLMAHKIIFDLRNMLDRAVAEKHGFICRQIGKQTG